MDKKELKIYQEAVKKKYKYHTLWKILAIVFMCLTFILAGVYFGSGDVFKQTVNNNDVEIINENSGNNNNTVTITN